MRVPWRTTVLATIALVGAAMPARTARADILPADGSPTITATTGGFNWTYDITLTVTEQLLQGDSFTIYDFGPGHVVSLPSANWTVTTDPFAPTTGTSSTGTITPTQTSALNYTFTWLGGTITGEVDLGNFVLFSTTGTPMTAPLMGRATDQSNGLKNANLTNTLVPTGTPEPANLALLGTGMLALAGFVQRRKRLS